MTAEEKIRGIARREFLKDTGLAADEPAEVIPEVEEIKTAIKGISFVEI